MKHQLAVALLSILFLLTSSCKPMETPPPTGGGNQGSGNGAHHAPPSDAPVLPETCNASDLASTGRLTPMISNRPQNLKIALNNAVHGISWDGRLFIITRLNPEAPPYPQGWWVSVFRPENLKSDSRGIPIFSEDTNSDMVLWEQNGDPNTGTDAHNTLAIFPTPGRNENPFSSNAEGLPQVDGAYKTYEMHLVSPMDSVDNMTMRRARIVVSNFAKSNAAVQKLEMLGPAQLMKSTDGKNIRGIEPSLTHDGRLLFFQGSPKNDGGIDYIMYSFNDNPGSLTGWSIPRSISDLYYLERNRVVAGTPFHELYPIAKFPLKDAGGTPYQKGEYYFGAYPWISHDGTELFHTAYVAGCAPDEARCPDFLRGTRALRGGLSVIGRWTNWTLRHIDGPANPQRFCIGQEATIRTITNSLGAMPGMWAPFRETENLPIPYTGARPVYPLVGAVRFDYQEVSFEDFQDRDYLVFLRMNELVTRDPSSYKSNYVKSNLTPDTSGNILNGTLKTGAAFPQEYNGTDEIVGSHGQGIYFPDSGSVKVPTSSKFSDIKEGFTVELFIKRLVNLDVDTQNRYRVLVNKPGSFNLVMEKDGRLNVTVYLLSGAQVIEHRSGQVGSPFALNEWVHAAFSFDPRSGALRVYQNGRLVSENIFEKVPVQVSATELTLGPAGQIAPLWTDAKQALFILDEFKLSRVPRREEEIRVSAFVNGTIEHVQNYFNLPLGLSRSELRIPKSNIPNQKAIELGARLFSDTLLSKNNDMSCATCHQPGIAFTDGFDRAHGDGGKILRRNTPTIFNRALSTTQFWDGRSPSLEHQALQPIENPAEMNSSLPVVIQKLSSDASYVKMFKDAFNGNVTSENIGKALATFQRSQFQGNSRADQFEAGQISALSDSEQRGRVVFYGKGRCASCHNGSNFSDEGFHNNGFTCTNDFGLEETTHLLRDRRLFKTPSLRGLNMTAPYMHDGSVNSIEETIETYNRGGNNKENLDSEMRPLNLTPQEKQDLANFLRSI